MNPNSYLYYSASHKKITLFAGLLRLTLVRKSGGFSPHYNRQLLVARESYLEQQWYNSPKDILKHKQKLLHK
jgi:hypothetical protein